MKKKCSRCGKTGEFYRDSKSWCKDCCREDSREYYRRKPAGFKNRAKKHRLRLRDHLIGFVNDFKQKRGCYFCKEKTLCVLDFHHIIKGEPVTRVANKSWSAFQKEINKGIIVCANCHRKIHGGLLVADESLIEPVKVPRLPKTESVDRKTPARHRRTNRIITHNGKSQTLVEWGEEISIDPNTLFMRLDSGWSVSKTLMTPKRVYQTPA